MWGGGRPGHTRPRPAQHVVTHCFVRPLIFASFKCAPHSPVFRPLAWLVSRWVSETLG